MSNIYEFFYNISNIVFATISIVSALFLMNSPLNFDEKFKPYRTSLRVLVLSYFSMGSLIFIEVFFNLTSIEYASSVYIGICISQSTLVTLTLCNILNPAKITKSVVAIHNIPIILFLLLHVILVPFYGNPTMVNSREFFDKLWHPVVIVRLVFLGVYAAQIAYYIPMFLRDLNIFHKKIDDFSADTAVMKLEWVKHSFVFMCVVGFSSLVISLVPLVIPNLILNILFVIFYTYFALRFIRFPRVLELAIPLFEPEQEPIIVQEPKSKTDVSPRHDWELLKKQLTNKKIYVRPGITIDTVASELGTGRSTLSTLIKTHEEVNFNVMINRLRIDEAQQLMRLNPAMSLAEVADHVGYTDQANFSRQFKLHAQVAPSVWRQNVIGSSN